MSIFLLGSPPGSPRSHEADTAIFEATLCLLGEFGYRGLTMESVAAKAGVRKTTVYRRFHDKADLVSAAVARLTDPGEVPDSGDLRTDLRKVLGGFHERGLERGTIDPCAPLDVAVDILTGAWFSRYLSGGRITAKWKDEVVTTVWRGVGG